MARPKLSNEEREARRIARVKHSFSDAAYIHYDTSNGYGDAEEWKRWAEEIFNIHADTETFIPPPKTHATQQSMDLTTLMLDAMPVDIAAFKRAYKNVMMIVHPDLGGSHEEMVAVNAAVERLLKFYK